MKIINWFKRWYYWIWKNKTIIAGEDIEKGVFVYLDNSTYPPVYKKCKYNSGYLDTRHFPPIWKN